ncbi:MAG: protein-L-isoaspartate(D-aspartate) O-methyltransferase [Bacteroidota bacterium]|nr:protein-L-isoaspartate(D-aspartate) O-methyltransferase [Bacteroidota bacterium]
MTDSFKYKGLRKQLVEGLRRKGIQDQRVLEAIMKVPRHYFMAKGFEERAYRDNAFPIASEQTISQPYTVAIQTELLEIKKRDKVLEIGTGSGYQTAVLLELGAKVYTIERQKTLFRSAQIILNKLNYSPHCIYGDGYKGLPGYAPFDKIIITAGASEIPQTLLGQLKIGGKMIIPVGFPNTQDMIELRKTGDNEYKKKSHGKFVFVPFLKGKN